MNWRALAISALCLVFVGLQMSRTQWTLQPLDGPSLALIVLALIPWLAPFVQSFKAPGGLEVVLRDLERRQREVETTVSQTQLAVSTGIGNKKNTVASSTGVPAEAGLIEHAAYADEASLQTNDPQKGKWGRRAARDGLILSAIVAPVRGAGVDLFEITMRVETTPGHTPLDEKAVVTFHLHPSFSQSIVTVTPVHGVASLRRIAWGSFTVGAVVHGPDGHDTTLELDLASVPNAPQTFRER